MKTIISRFLKCLCGRVMGLELLYDFGILFTFNNTPFLYKQSIFDPRPENSLSLPKKSPEKFV